MNVSASCPAQCQPWLATQPRATAGVVQPDPPLSEDMVSMCSIVSIALLPIETATVLGFNTSLRSIALPLCGSPSASAGGSSTTAPCACAGNGLNSISLESAVPEWEDERVRVCGESAEIPRTSCVERRSARARSAASRRLQRGAHCQYILRTVLRSSSDTDQEDVQETPSTLQRGSCGFSWITPEPVLTLTCAVSALTRHRRFSHWIGMLSVST
jgi:hypothetical protein